MPHVSRKEVAKATHKKLGSLVEAFLDSTNDNVRIKMFREIYTHTEQLMIAKRLALLFLIEKDSSPLHISKLLKMSPSTIARFEHNVDRGKYKETRKWLKRHSIDNRILRLLAAFASIPFKRSYKSLGSLLEGSH